MMTARRSVKISRCPAVVQGPQETDNPELGYVDLGTNDALTSLIRLTSASSSGA